jgi:deoxyadenosine/deoxycytidine kinase
MASDIHSPGWPVIVSIEGNIGSGKSTLLRELKEHHQDFLHEHGIVLVQEPVDVWMNYLDPEDGESILKKFYDNPERYAFLFQLVIYESIMDAIDTAITANPDARVLLCERSVSSSHEVFMKMFRDDGEVNALEYKYYRTMADNPDLERYRPSHLFYLDTPIGVCIERIEVRGRENESNITEHYLDKCEFYTEHWFKSVVSRQGEPGVPEFRRLDDNDPTTFIQTWHNDMSSPARPVRPHT